VKQTAAAKKPQCDRDQVVVGQPPRIASQQFGASVQQIKRPKTVAGSSHHPTRYDDDPSSFTPCGEAGVPEA
jgi:hypothetical protein